MVYHVMQEELDIQVPLKEDEIKVIISLLDFASTSCPVFDINEHLKIEHGMIQRILQKMLESIAIKPTRMK